MIPQEDAVIARVVSLYEVDDERFVTIYYLNKPKQVSRFIRYLVAMGSLPWLEWVSMVREKETDSILIGFSKETT